MLIKSFHVQAVTVAVGKSFRWGHFIELISPNIKNWTPKQLWLVELRLLFVVIKIKTPVRVKKTPKRATSKIFNQCRWVVLNIQVCTLCWTGTGIAIPVLQYTCTLEYTCTSTGMYCNDVCVIWYRYVVTGMVVAFWICSRKLNGLYCHLQSAVCSLHYSWTIQSQMVSCFVTHWWSLSS